LSGDEGERAPVELTVYPNRALVEAAANFAGMFHHWIDDLASDGMTYPRLRLLEELHCRGPEKMGTLAERLGLSARNMTAVADALEADALLQRMAHPTDRRATLLKLTPAGMCEADEALAPRLAGMGELFDSLSPNQRASLLEALNTLIKQMTLNASPG
jgi:DNA-binding MarR family transcriptional regulator